jgi:hypothetical protein
LTARPSRAALVACLLAASSAAAATHASAQAPATTAVSAAELGALAAQLGSEDPSAREAAHAALRTLDEGALPGIEARIAAMASRRPPPGDVSAAIADIRHGAGSRRADDNIDIGPGVLPALALRRDPAMLSVCESIVLWRALEAMGTTNAYRLIADVVALDGAPWDQETHRFVDRAGARLGPMLIMARSHPSASVRRWSRWAGTELGFDVPGRAIQLPLIARDSTLLADALRAYGSVRQLDAMRVIASYVGSQHAQVREAARAALAQYGRNGIWVLREQLELVTGADADPTWGWERTMTALYAAHDDARLAPVRAALAAGQQAAAQSDFERMARQYDAVLLRAPELAQREQMAPGYASLGAQRRDAHDVPGAERAYRRAVFLAPTHGQAPTWRAALLALHADAELTRGVADLHAYGQVIEASPGDTHARAVLDQLSGNRAARARTKKRVATGGAALLLAVVALVLLGRRAESKNNASPYARSATTHPPRNDDDTSPGSLTAPTS